MPLIILLAVTTGVYLNGLKGTFVWTDKQLIQENTHLKSISGAMVFFKEDLLVFSKQKISSYRPLPMLSFALDYYMWYENPTGYHLTSFIIHLLVSLSIYWLITLLFDDWRIAFFSSLLFAVHPAHTQSISFISGRSAPMAALFMLLCLIFYVKARQQRSVTLLILMPLSTILALLSHEFALILPFIIIISHVVTRCRPKLVELGSIPLLAGAYLLFRIFIVKIPLFEFLKRTSLLQRIAGFFAALTSYVRILMLPLHLHIDYGKWEYDFTNIEVIIGLLFTLLTLTLAWQTRTRKPALSFGILWFFSALLPFTNIYPLAVPISEHYLYFASIGFFLITGWILAAGSRKRRLVIISVIIVSSLTVFWSVTTIKQNRFWNNSLALYGRALRYTKDSSNLFNNLGLEYGKVGNLTKAIACYQEAITLDPKIAAPYVNLGNAYNKSGEHAKAIITHLNALKLDQKNPNILFNLGNAYSASKQWPKAIDSYHKALKYSPRNLSILNNLGNEYCDIGMNKEGEEMFKRILEINPDYGYAHQNLAALYFQTDRLDLAVLHLERALELGCNVPKDLIDHLEYLR